MSCDVTKLNYLNETKQMIRNKIDPDGKKITDETPFREYCKYVGSGAPVAESVLVSDPVPQNLSVIGTATYEEIPTQEE